jgi:hypothetical protein
LGCKSPDVTGDGTFKDRSNWNGAFYVRGYGVSFPEFDLGAAQESQYRVAGLKGYSDHCIVHLTINPPEGVTVEETKQFDGFLQLELVDSKGESVAKASGRLGDFTWANRKDLYQSGSSFTPDPKETYVLHLSYSPDQRLQGWRGFAYIEVGGVI